MPVRFRPPASTHSTRTLPASENLVKARVSVAGRVIPSFRQDLPFSPLSDLHFTAFDQTGAGDSVKERHWSAIDSSGAFAEGAAASVHVRGSERATADGALEEATGPRHNRAERPRSRRRPENPR
jgi:hypothetical protein